MKIYAIGHSPEFNFRRLAIEHVSKHGSLTLPSSSGGATPNLNCHDWHIHTRTKTTTQRGIKDGLLTRQSNILRTQHVSFDKNQLTISIVS